MSTKITVAPASLEHYERIVDYFVNGDLTFLDGMGVDPKKLPARAAWIKGLYENHYKPAMEKTIYYVVWYVNEQPIGHSNINKIIFGKEAYMHLHMWDASIRKSGLGFQLVSQSIPYYFNTFNLEHLYCEPYAHNPAPNKTLKKIGFEFVQQYETIPGPISYLQPVNRWHLFREKFMGILNRNPI